ncbi:hypothetical protein Q4S33_02115 [Acinetobacter calcoaceticus]|nr:hypothetical protein Q4S33_02115 [Acinetobacter calcoaceticus]
MSFNFLKIFTQNLDPDKDQIWHCLIMTPIHLYIIALFLLLGHITIYGRFAFGTIGDIPIILLFMTVIYYVLVFIPAYFLQLFLLKFNFLNFFSILVSAIFLSFLIPNILAILFIASWQILPIEIIFMVSFFSLIFAITYWILLLKSMKKAAK